MQRGSPFWSFLIKGVHFWLLDERGPVFSGNSSLFESGVNMGTSDFKPWLILRAGGFPLKVGVQTTFGGNTS